MGCVEGVVWGGRASGGVREVSQGKGGWKGSGRRAGGEGYFLVKC